MPDSTALLEATLEGFPLVARGKVRDIFAIGDDHLALVATDRLSAFDVILPNGVPGKGEILTRMSRFWFDATREIVPNHLTDLRLTDVAGDTPNNRSLNERTMIVRKLNPLPMEAVVRGYLIGSGWKDYRQSGSICGHQLPSGLKLADRLAQPLFTPATKAAVGDHDENIDLTTLADLIGPSVADEVQRISLSLYAYGAAFASVRGIIIADTKFEFGLDQDGVITLIDEALTPDSSRFWPAKDYRPGSSPASFDKQFVRDYLETLDWDKTAPGPELPPAVVEGTTTRYEEALSLLTASD
ncbi:MAG: phosphoribosylaminoimidazolesuccinocarboxamide synthase [Pseudomonadota bacterium]